MKCKVKDCYNTVDTEEKYCKYHLIKRSNKHGKIITVIGIVTSIAIMTGVTRLIKEKVVHKY